MLCEGIDATPRSDKGRVEELLGSPGLPQPDLPSEHDDHEDDAVCDEGASHDEMCQTLTKVILMAVAQRSDPTKEHLYPSYHRHGLSDDAVSVDRHPPDLPMEPLFEMEFEVYAEDDLHDQHNHQDVRKRSVDILRKCSSLVHVSQKVSNRRNHRPEDLQRYMPSIPNNLLLISTAQEVVDCNLHQGPFQLGR